MAALVTMAQGESRPIRAVRWGGRVWWVASQGGMEGSFNTPLPSIVGGNEARVRGFRTCMGIQALGSASYSNYYFVQNMWNKGARRA